MGAALRAADPGAPYAVLATLPFKFYLTTNPDNLLAEALTAVQRAPEVELCHWTDEIDWPPSVYSRDPPYQPTPARPLIYHLFGHFNTLDSVVLTEDGYFDYLPGVAAHPTAVHNDVGTALNNASLLFLGFRLDDWDFRALFHSLMRQEGRNLPGP